ncbi:MAG TPA: 3-deoxy-D-manno-octulosonic acid transferase [Phycisphaeraceae bacterium]
MSLSYDLAYTTAAVLGAPVWGYRLLRTGKWRTDWAGRFGRGPALSPPPTGTRRLLIHAVSVGEVSAVRLLVEQLRQQQGPRVQVVISTTTDTGLARARRLFEPHHPIVRYPLDFTAAVNRFLDRVQPNLVALTELEVWPNFVAACCDRGIPVCVINGRLSQRSYENYRRLAALVRPTFARLAAVAAQTPDYAQRFIGLGVDPSRVQVLDTMKWDTAQIADAVDGAAELARAMGIDPARPLVVAGSTGPGEEAMLIQQCPPQAQLLLVPRKPERFEEVAALAPGIVRRSRQPDGATPPQQPGRLFLLDTMGELRKAYALADVVVVGRSFNGLGGSDPIEPVALGKPAIVGPDHHNFADVVDALRQQEGIWVTDHPHEAISTLLADRPRAQRLAQAGRQVIRARQGATDRHAQLLLRLLESPQQSPAAR